MKKTVQPLMKWYYQQKRDLPWRNTKDPYYIWISEIMLQQTRVDTVIQYYQRFIQTLPTIKDLSEVEDDLLYKLWEGLGYYSRAKNLKIAANQIMNDYAGKFPQDYDIILGLKGIGPYTAGAISSIAFNIQKPAVDGNVLRVISRIDNRFDDIAKSETIKKITADLAMILPKQVGDFNQALMELGALICTPKKPLCEQCPIQKHCLAFKHQTQHLLPIKNKKLKRKSINKTFFLFVVENKIAIEKNTSQTLFYNMWQFPSVENHMSKQDVIQNFECFKIHCLKPFKHVFTHMDWLVQAYVVYLNQPLKQYAWKEVDTFSSQIALPTVYKKCFDQYLLMRLQENEDEK